MKTNPGMKTNSIFTVLRLSVIFSLLFSFAPAGVVFSAPPAQIPPEADPNQTADIPDRGVVLVANKIIDLKWDPVHYPSSPGRFKRWELYRGTSPVPTQVITSGTDQTTSFYRDRGIGEDGTYYYRLVVVRCNDPCLTRDDEVQSTFFEDSITTGVFSGYLTRSLELPEGTYPIGFSEIDSTAAVRIQDDAALSVNANARLTKAPDVSHGSLSVLDGSLSIKGASLSSVSLHVGEYGGTETNCSATLDTVSLVDSSIMVNAGCSLNMTGGGGTTFISAYDHPSLNIQRAYIEGSVELFGQALGHLSDNHIIGKVVVDGYYAAAVPKATAYLHANVISTPYKTNLVSVVGGATAYLTENTFSYTGLVENDTALLLEAISAGTKLVAQSNRLENGKLFISDNPSVEITDNVLVGAGSAITVGCIFCGTNQQATGSIERNTLQSGWGLEMWDGSQFLTIKHNCVRGNNPGLTVVNTLPVNLNVQENYWGAANGPRHPTNPAGSGDEIVGAKVDFSNWETTDANCREAPPPSVPDIFPIGMEVTQVVQTMDNSVHLVADHLTAVRVYAQSTRPGATVDAILRAYRGDVLIGSDLPSELITVPGYTPLLFLRTSLNSWFFYLPPAWVTAGDLRLVAEVNHDSAVAELDHTNNTIERTVTFTPRRTLRVAMIPVHYAYPGYDETPTRGEIDAAMELTRHMYPLQEVQIEILTPLEWTVSMFTEPVQNFHNNAIMNLLYDRLTLHNNNRPPERQFDQVFGVFPRNANLPFCISNPRWYVDPASGASGRGRAGYCSVWPEGIAHEIAHNLGLRHPNTPDSCNAQDPNTDWPFTNATIGEVGLDVFTHSIRNPSRHDIMSYCIVQQWLAPFNANKLFNSNGLPQPPRIADTTYLFARGQISQSGAASLYPAWQLTLDTLPENPPEGSSYCLQLQNAGGARLSSYCFDPQYTNHEIGEAAESAEFSFALPLVSGAARLVLTRAGVVVAQSDASPAQPTVTLTYPNGGEQLSGNFTAAWSASDADGDELFYHLLYSVDDGATWTPLAEYLTETSFTLDTAILTGTSTGRLRVMASDGFHTTQDDSNAGFTTPDNPPEAGIGAPLDGESGWLPLQLSGAGYDLEDGSLSGDSLQWQSDRDGTLGAGRDLLLESLTLGVHHITLTVTDSQDQTGAVTIVYTVIAQPHIYLPAISR